MRHIGSLPPVRLLERLFAASAVVGLLSGCATTTDCNPSQDPGLIGTIVCQNRYRERINELEAIKASEYAKSSDLDDDLRDLERQKYNVDEQLRIARVDIADLQRRLNSVNSRIIKVKGANDGLKADIRSLQSRISQLKKAVDAGSVSTTELTALRKELAKKEAVVETLSN